MGTQVASAVAGSAPMVEIGPRTVLTLTRIERDALIRLLYVVEDNFWLDSTEESLLERLLKTA